MPRPLGLILGEGTTKNQRGMGDLVVSSNPLAAWNANQTASNNSSIPYEIDSSWIDNLDFNQAASDMFNVYSPSANSGSTVGNKISLGMIALIGIGLVLILKK